LQKFGIFNGTKINSKDLEQVVLECLAQEFSDQLPDFYVIVKEKGFDGVTITNLDRPTILVAYENIEDFRRTLIHELVHLKQHQKGYADEKEAYDKSDPALSVFKH